MIFFLSPIIILSLHSFSNHEHAICISEVETHVHEKDSDCNLHLSKLPNTFLEKQDFHQRILASISEKTILQYNFLKNHHSLTFSLRGPPASVI